MVLYRGKGWYGFLLPEHREGLQPLLNPDESLEMPQLTEDRFLEIQYAIEEGWNTEQPIVCEYIKNGKKRGFCGFIEQINQQDQWLILQNGPHQQKIDFAQIYAAEIMDDIQD